MESYLNFKMCPKYLLSNRLSFFYFIFLVAYIGFESLVFAQTSILNKPLLKDFTAQDFPRIQKADYYSLQKDLFLSKIEDGLPQWYNENQRALLIQKLRPEIKEMYFWLYLDGQVSNGGFSQFFDNGFGYMIPEIKKFYLRVREEKGLEILEKAEEWYKNRTKEEVWMDLTLDNLDKSFLANEHASERIIEAYVRANSHLYVRDENGEVFPQNFSGGLESIDLIRKVRKLIKVEDNSLVGPVRLLTLDGVLIEELNFANGQQVGSQKYYDESGRLEREEILYPTPAFKDIRYFYPSGQLKISFRQNDAGQMVEEYSRLHENGSLAFSYQLDDSGNHTGPYFTYYPDGSKMLEVDRRGGEPKYMNYWDDNGNQQLKDGTGDYTDIYAYEGDTTRYEYHFVDYKKHGIQREFRNGVLTKYTEMNQGQYDGYHREFYPNGRLKQEYLIKAGKAISQNTQPRFENPVLRVKIQTQENETWIQALEYELTDTYPVLLNGDEVKGKINLSPWIFEMYWEERELSAHYLLHINSQGEVTGHNFASADNGFVTRAVEELFPYLKFTPGKRGGKPVDSYLGFWVKLWFEEGDALN